jgi:hypothetical protein
MLQNCLRIIKTNIHYNSLTISFLAHVDPFLCTCNSRSFQLLNPENQPLFIHGFSGPEHEYLEKQYHTLCELQDTMLKLDNLLKFTINNLRMRGISALIFAIKDLWSANLRLQTTLWKRTMHQGHHCPYPPAPATTPLQNLSSLRTSNESSSHNNIMEDVVISLNQPKCVPPNQNTPSAIPVINLSATTPPLLPIKFRLCSLTKFFLHI